MRASDTYTESLFTMSKLEDFIPQNHPLRPIRKMVNEALVLEVALTAAMTLSRIFRHRRHTRSSSALYTGEASKAGAAQNGYQRYTRSLSHKLSSGTKVIMARQPPTTNT